MRSRWIIAGLMSAAGLLAGCGESSREPSSAADVVIADVASPGGEDGGPADPGSTTAEARAAEPDATARIGVTIVPTTAAPAEFAARVEPVTAAELGSSWKPGMGCPDPAALRMVTLSYWGYDGRPHHDGRLVVAASYADRVVAAMADVYAARFPIERMVPVDAYGGDDQASMRANNTSAFNCRHVAGTSRLSEHGLGQAIDINPLVNPYLRDGTVDPPEGAPWADRTRTDPGMIRPDDAVVRAFATQGWSWGGHWTTGQDLQHFSAGGR